MKLIIVLFFFIFLTACSSNTIYKEPENLIPKDSMMMVIEDLIIASSSKHLNNKNNKNNINYLPLVKEAYKIDSTRFMQSNIYYTSKIDLYVTMLTEVRENIALKRTLFKKIKRTKDSIKFDSLKNIQKLKLDSIKSIKNSVQRDSLQKVIEGKILLLEEQDEESKIY